MTIEHQRRVRELFDAALDQPEELRQQFLSSACDSDQELLNSVVRLLAAHQRSAGVLDTPVWERREVVAVAREPGSYIGPYKILQELGGGGMGIVYQVIRADEVFQRICAVKVIRPELTGDWLLERFRQERHILARLDHPNIARIIDGGSTAEGLPYFVMDYVDGPPIGEFCSRHGLSTRQRLALFQRIGAAVRYLHDNGVIHGDLKPPNVLVGHDSLVKLVDFGIASALSARDGNDDSAALPLMTPGYASPEQLRGQRLTPMSDVYSLGVLLYELLTGAQPARGSHRTRSEILNAIATEDPLPPSIAVATADTQLPEGRPSVAHTLKGDLDCIVLQAMHREPERRYQSVGELTGDIDRYLDNRTVTARKSGLLSKGRKLFLRQRRAVLATCVIATLLGTASWQGMELRKRYDRAQLLESQVRDLQVRLDAELKKRRLALPGSTPQGSPPGAKPVAGDGLGGTQLLAVSSLGEAYRTSFSESLRLWPGATPSRQDLLDRTDRYLREVEPLAEGDAGAREQLALAWLWLANAQGNPQTPNLGDHVGATASIRESERLVDASPLPSGLVDRIRATARLIEAAHD